MTWFKVDDTLAAHPKARAAGLPAMGMWVVAGAYCGQQLTDGFVPDWFVTSWPGGAKHAQRLVDVGLWKPAKSGWRFHEWEQSNPTRSQVQAERARSKKRQAEYREARLSRRDNGVSHTVDNAVTTGAPTRPDPTRSCSSVESEVEVELRAPENFAEDDPAAVRRTLRAVVATWEDVDPDELAALEDVS